VGGHLLHTNDDMQFVEANFTSYESAFVEDWREGGYYCDIRDGDDQRAVFWTALLRRFPRVVDVVLTQSNSSRLGTPALDKATRLATGSPDGITIGITELRWYSRTDWCPSSRYIWRRDRSKHKSPIWEVTETSRSPRRMTPPIRIYSGVVGAYQR
jgi:hypothetical protein